MGITVAIGGDGKARIGDGLATGREQQLVPEVAEKLGAVKREKKGGENCSRGVRVKKWSMMAR